MHRESSLLFFVVAFITHFIILLSIFFWFGFFGYGLRNLSLSLSLYMALCPAHFRAINMLSHGERFPVLTYLERD